MRWTTIGILGCMMAAGCDEIGGKGDDTGSDTGATTADTDTDVDTTTTDTDDTDTTTPTDTETETTPGPWSVSYHPCAGNRTDALWHDDLDTAYVGCGSTTVGYDMFVTTDGGASWGAMVTDPPGLLSQFRVNSISRSSDGLLYVAGTDTTSSLRVVSLDTSVSPAPVTAVHVSDSFTWQNFHVGTFRRLSDGWALGESLTGTDTFWRNNDSEDFQDGYGWWTDPFGQQILDMVVHDDKIYGVGSTISQPPVVFLPDRNPTPGVFSQEEYVLADPNDPINGFDGELWGLDVDASGLVAVGVNQDSDAGQIFVSQGDVYDGNFLHLDMFSMYSDSTWMRGVCRNGDHILAVGEFSQTSEALVLESTDGGSTWNDVTPPGYDALHKCEAHSNGTFTVTGAGGFFGWYMP